MSVFTIIMGQAFRDELPKVIEELSGEVETKIVSATDVSITALFHGRRSRAWLKRELHDRIPGPAIYVEGGPEA